MDDAIKGFWVAVATPLGPDGAVDGAALARHADFLLGQGCDGLVLFGTTGEGTSFSGAERLAAVEGLLRHGIGPERMCIGSGCPAIPDTAALTRGALALGLVHALVLPPYFYRDVEPEGLEATFSAIIDQVDDDRLRLTLYHIPQVSGVGIPAVLLPALRQRYGRLVAGVKDSSADFESFRKFRAACPDAAVTVGNESDIGRAVAEGGAGTICGMANIVPGLVRRMFGKDAPEAEMREAVGHMSGPFLAKMKAVLAAQTGEDGWLRVRAPLRPADIAVGERILTALEPNRPAAAA